MMAKFLLALVTLVVTLLTFTGESKACEVVWEKVGCFHDRIHPDRPLVNELVNRRDPTNPHYDGTMISWKKYTQSLNSLVCKCAKLAKKANYPYFGIQFFGECWSGPSPHYDRDGSSKKCVGVNFKPCVDSASTPCTGKQFTNYIYSVKPASVDPCEIQNGGCSQVCKSKGSELTCSCNDGFTLKRDGKTCVKINPCEIKNGGCGQVCLSEGEDVTCFCNHGYKLNKDGKSCDKECKGVADIGFILDSSGSLKDHYQDEKNFLEGLARAFGISREGSHAGVVTFSTKAVLSIKLNHDMSQSSFNNDVDNIPILDEFTRIDLGLKLAKEELFSEKNGARSNVAKLCVLITDGTQTTMPGSEDPAKIAAQIRAAGIRMVVIGIGSQIDQDELAKIAGNPKDVYTTANFQALQSTKFANSVKNAMCEKHKKG